MPPIAPSRHPKSLRDLLGTERATSWFWAAHASVCLDELTQATSLGGALSDLSGRSILIATTDQLATALALVELDGLARRLIICPPDVPAEHFSHLIKLGEADALVHGPEGPRSGTQNIAFRAICSPKLRAATSIPARLHETEWILLTSGTTGLPKMVVHTLATLTAAIKVDPERRDRVVWGTFYDIRRYGGMQIFLRAMLGHSSLVLSSSDEPTADHLHRLGRLGVTHLTGTPSHWRWAILTPRLAPSRPATYDCRGKLRIRQFWIACRNSFHLPKWPMPMLPQKQVSASM
jgi:non-ribosomal peptide synthetase component F